MVRKWRSLSTKKKKREEGKQGKINPYTGDKNKQKLREGEKRSPDALTSQVMEGFVIRTGTLIRPGRTVGLRLCRLQARSKCPGETEAQ